MSTTLSYIGKQIYIYCGTPVLIIGIVGDLLNILVFLSLKTFRQSSCAFYLTIMSIINIFVLLLGLSTRVFIAFSDIDPSEVSLFYCQFRSYFTQICMATSLTCWCLATIDQYFATCSRPRWQQYCNIKLGQRLVILTIIFWTLHGIPYPIFYNQIISLKTHKITCVDTNSIFDAYRSYFILLGIYGFIPIIIAGIFGSMAFYNVKQMAYRTVPLIRRELEKQLTVMVLVLVATNIFTLLPYAIVNAVATNTNLMNDPVAQAQIQTALNITLLIFYITFANPFYIYICVSERFRRQLVHVFTQILFNRCKRPRTDTNQVVPEA